jgi:hypothetical protein
MAPLLESVHAADREWAKSIIATHFRGLWSDAGCLDALEALVTTYGSSGRWPAVWHAIAKTLDFDGDRLDAGNLSRLTALHAVAAPVDLASQIGAFAFVDEWTHVRDDGESFEQSVVALRERVMNLGRALVADPAVFDQLAPVLWTNGARPVEWLGQGYGAAFQGGDAWVDRVIASIKTHPASRLRTRFIEGALIGLNDVAPHYVPAAIERLLAVEELKESTVDLLAATPLSPWSSARLFEAARAGGVPAYRFELLGYGRTHEPMTDADFAPLIEAVSRLPRGAQPALRLMTMRFYDKDRRGYTPDTAVLAAVRRALAALLAEHVERLDATNLHGLQEVLAQALGSAAPDHEVAALIEALCECVRASWLSASELTPVVGALLAVRTTETLDALYGAADVADWLLGRRSSRDKAPLNEAPAEAVLKWSAGEQARIEWVASLIAIYTAGTPQQDLETTSAPVLLSEHFHALFAQAPEKAPILEAAVHAAVPTSWMNSRARIIEVRMDALATLRASADPEVRNLVEDKLAGLLQRLRQEQDWEASEAGRRERRFE